MNTKLHNWIKNYLISASFSTRFVLISPLNLQIIYIQIQKFKIATLYVYIRIPQRMLMPSTNLKNMNGILRTTWANA